MLHGDSFLFPDLFPRLKIASQRCDQSMSIKGATPRRCWLLNAVDTVCMIKTIGCCQRASLPFGTIRAQNVQILSFFLTFLMIALIWNPTIVKSFFCNTQTTTSVMFHWWCLQCTPLVLQQGAWLETMFFKNPGNLVFR